MIHSTRRRTLVKAAVWRVVATIATFGVVYIYTGQAVASVEITVAVAIVSTLTYYFHERAWDSISWGRIEAPCERAALGETHG